MLKMALCNIATRLLLCKDTNVYEKKVSKENSRALSLQ
jgi:hypothetical protein